MNSRSEDALNLIRCKFIMDHCYIAHTFSDGFDADFCSGVVHNSRFGPTKNDCMDFSGSKISVDNYIADGAGDKGISCGEESEIEIFNAEIKNSNSGIASKDLSGVTIHNVKLNSVKQGFLLYEKKPEYGSSWMKVIKYEAKGVNTLHMVQKGSSLEIEGKIVRGTF